MKSLPVRDRVRALVDPLWLCVDENGTAYMTIPIDEGIQHRQEVHALHSTAGRRLLIDMYVEKYGSVPSSQGLKEGTDALDARAQGAIQPVGLRTMSIPDGFAIDLGDKDWTRVLVTAGKWRLVHEGPLFRRGTGAKPLPIPLAGGSLDMLRRFLNVQSDADWSLVLAWLVYALQPHGPYPILALQGEHGSSKSTLARVLLSLTDPNEAPLASVPRSGQELMVIARSRHVLALDNLSRLDPDLKDGLCRLATGSGHVARKLYSDDEAVVWNACRPIILNGIDNLLVADDLTDRCISITLPPIPKHLCQKEEAFWAEFSRERRLLFGALLDAAASALHARSRIDVAGLPRMADFAAFAAAAAPNWGDTVEGWLDRYNSNRRSAIERGMDGDPLARSVRSFLEGKPSWEGAYAELLQQLNGLTDDSAQVSPSWPKAAQGLSDRLRRIAPGLRAVGIDVVELGRRRKGYTVYLRRIPGPSDVPGVPGVPPPLLNLEEEKRKRLGSAGGSPGTPGSPVEPPRPGEEAL